MKFYSLILVIFSLVIFESCSAKKKYHYQEKLLGTIASITFITQSNDKKAKLLSEKLWKDIRALDYVFSNYKKDSELNKLNKHLASRSYKKPYQVSKPLYDVLSLSRDLCLDTQGSFNIAVSPIIKLWKNKLKDGKTPTKKELNKLQALLACDNLLFSSMKYVSSKRQGVMLDLGGIAKGYIIDFLGKKLEQKNIKNYIVDIGGDMLISGSKFGKAWNILLKNPDTKNLKMPYLAKCRYKNKKVAIATSGSYYRYTELNGHKYSHIIDPLTLSPTNTDIKSISIIGKTASLVDAYATGLYVKGSTLARNFLDNKSFNGIIISERGNYEKKTDDCDNFVSFLHSSTSMDTARTTVSVSR